MGFKLKKTISLRWLAKRLNLKFVVGAADVIENVAPLGSVSNGSLSFSIGSKTSTNNNIILIASSVYPAVSCIVSENPRMDFIRALNIIDVECGFYHEIGPSIIHPSVLIGEGVFVGKGVKIGKNTVIEPNVVLLSGVSIGENCLIRANATLGSDGFGFERNLDGVPLKFIHLGSVRIGNNVEVGANACIAKGVFDATVIEDNVKIDNLVQIAHNCEIGKSTMIASNAAVGGSVKIGDECWVSTSVCIKNGVKIDNNAFIGIGSVVLRNIKKGVSVFGNPAIKM